MLVLGIDTSCDDTSASLLRLHDGKPEVLTNIVSCQSEIHAKYGGIVPELASRSHTEMIWPVTEEALAGHTLDDLGAVAVCWGPGLIGSLLVGCSFAKSMCFAKGIPLVAVNHLEGHLLSPFLTGDPPAFPFFSLVVSGGHTSIYKVNGYCNYEELGHTRDDAAGEAYDKVAKLLGLGYPGGPVIDRISRSGDASSAGFPRPYLPESYDFSFSGLKTAVRLAHEKRKELGTEDIAAGFQASVVDVLTRKTEKAFKDYGIKRIALTGGVAANSELRERMSALCEKKGAVLYLPPVTYCTDNAAMIALAGYHRYMKGERASVDLNPKAYLPL
jgi:N6-L-threonylcarbamoyladenine synthase